MGVDEVLRRVLSDRGGEYSGRSQEKKEGEGDHLEEISHFGLRVGKLMGRNFVGKMGLESLAIYKNGNVKFYVEMVRLDGLIHIDQETSNTQELDLELLQD